MTVGTFVLLLILGALALVVFGMAKSVRSRVDRDGFAAGFDQAHFCGPCALALSTANSRLKIRTRGMMKMYPLSDVRTWEKHWHNSKRQGTLTLSMRDVDHPVWTIRFLNESEMNRWYERLNQAING